MPTLGKLQLFDDGDLVLGLAEPAAVVVEADRAADFGGLLGDRADTGRFDLHSCLALFFSLRRAAATHDPKLRF